MNSRREKKKIEFHCRVTNKNIVEQSRKSLSTGNSQQVERIDETESSGRDGCRD